MTPDTRREKGKWDLIPMVYPAQVAIAGGAKPEKVIVEVGPGRGDYLFQLAGDNPDAEIVGIELKVGRYFKLIERIQKRALTNVRLIQADARLAIERYFEANSIDTIHVNFPDPWPKRRHSKNRLFNDDFLKRVFVILKKGGVLSFITDQAWYAEDVVKNIARLKIDAEFTPSPESVEFFPTFFAQKWKKEGRSFTWVRWRKR